MPWCYRAHSAQLARTGRAFVINLDNDGQKGTHWTAARVVNGVLYYADPFGSILNGWPPEELSGYRAIISRVAFQRPSTHLCGYYALLFAQAMDTLHGTIGQKDFEDLLLQAI